MQLCKELSTIKLREYYVFLVPLQKCDGAQQYDISSNVICKRIVFLQEITLLIPRLRQTGVNHG